jgi:flagellar biosynthesis activator protein FlaF
MNRRYWIVYGNKLQAYKTTRNLTQSGRELEVSVLMQAASIIKECRDNWDAPDRDAKLDKALTNNQRLWSILQGELIKDDNPLPRKIREDLLNLSVFVDKRSFEVKAHPVPEKLTILIDINLNIAAGLSTIPAE